LAIYQKAVYYLGVQIFNNLPSDIKNISSNLERFERIKKHFLITHLSTHWRNIISDDACGT